ncbi:hypothetical protein SUDANB126_01937 [Streptomyces sp. enrichment culture]
MLGRNRFNGRVRRPALRAAAGVEIGRGDGVHALRRLCAPVLLDAGESIGALSECPGHHGPGFTLRTYAHLMPSGENRTRAAVDRVLQDEDPTEGGPEPARGRVGSPGCGCLSSRSSGSTTGRPARSGRPRPVS